MNHSECYIDLAVIVMVVGFLQVCRLVIKARRKGKQ
jgi:hypothetical protein